MEKRSPIFIALAFAALALFAIKGGLWSPRAASHGGDTPPARDAATQNSVARASRLEPTGDSRASPLEVAENSPKPAAKSDPVLKYLHERLDKPGIVAGEALLSFKSKEAMEHFAQQAAARGLNVLGAIPQLNALRIQYGALDPLRDAIAAAGAGEVNVEGNPWLSIPPPVPQPASTNQQGAAPYGYSTMDAINAVGDRSHWGDNVTVAVLDTGVLDHPTFGAGQVTHLDLVNDGQPFNSHGTSVASLVGGQAPQAPGVAPGAQILDVRVVGAEGYTIGSVLAEGIVAATDHGAQVINISLGGYGDSTLLEQSIGYAFQHGVVVVASAGNEDYNQLAIPAAYQGVISVGSVDAKGQQAYFSNSGQGLDLAAPGVGVITAWSTNQLALASGTSQSAALVTGAAAAYLGWNVPSSDMTARLKADARPTGASTVEVGAGILRIRPPR